MRKRGLKAPLCRDQKIVAPRILMLGSTINSLHTAYRAYPALLTVCGYILGCITLHDLSNSRYHLYVQTKYQQRSPIEKVNYMSKLASFNTLPPKPQHLEKVLAALRLSEIVQLKDLISQTGLTRTQTLCALDALIKSGKVNKTPAAQAFSLTESSKDAGSNLP